MADYPNVVQVYRSVRKPDDGTVVEKSESGKFRLRSYYTQVRYTFLIFHEMDGPDKDLILAHYAAESANIFNFTFKADDSVHSCRYARPPMEEPIPGLDRWKVTTTLVVV